MMHLLRVFLELMCLYFLLYCRLPDADQRLDKAVLENERQKERVCGGNVNCCLVKVQGLRVSDIWRGWSCVRAGRWRFWFGCLLEFNM